MKERDYAEPGGSQFPLGYIFRYYSGRTCDSGGSFFAVRYGIADWEARGQFGDIFGAANALFSGLAFAALICTIILQQKQINDQISSAADERGEARQSAELGNRTVYLQIAGLLTDHYERQMGRIEGRSASGPEAAKLVGQLHSLTAKRSELESVVERLHAEVIAALGGENVRKSVD